MDTISELAVARCRSFTHDKQTFADLAVGQEAFAAGKNNTITYDDYFFVEALTRQNETDPMLRI